MYSLQAVIFDLDGVIADTACLHESAWRKLCTESLQVNLSDTFFERLKGIGRLESLQMILQESNRFMDFSKQEILELAAQKNKFYQESIEQLTPNDILPGIHALLSELKESKFLIGLASASQNAPMVLQKLQLTAYFDAVVRVTSEMPAKPNPTIFLTAADMLQVSPHNCVGIEDASAGITAILRSGMVAIGIGDADVLSHAHLCLPSTDALTLERILHVYQMNHKK